MTAMQVVVNLCLSVEKLIIYDAQVTLALSVRAGRPGGGPAAPAACWGRSAPPRWPGGSARIRLIAAAIAAAGVAVVLLGVAGSFPGLALANLGYGWALVVASLVDRTQRQPDRSPGRCSAG